MARIRFCPNCMTIIKRKDEKCSGCGMLVSDMEEKIEQEKAELEQLREGNLSEAIESDKKDETEVVEEKDAKIEEVIEAPKPKRHKHKKKAIKDVPQYTVDEDGSFHIDTKDVTFLDNSSYSSKKERGEYKPEKIEWWEIYKWADLHLARRKIMKEVNKAARVKPANVKIGWMAFWCVFFGWMGAHNYYAHNYKRGIFATISFIISAVFISVPALEPAVLFFGGGFGFIFAYMWIGDIIGLIFNRYKYRLSKEAFIAKLNVETRYKISKRYLKLDRIKAEQEKIKNKQKRKLEKKEAKKRAKI